MASQITPKDILDKEFNTKFRGYDPDEVDSFLEEIADAFTAKVKELNQVKDQLVSCQNEIKELKDRQTEVQQAIISANRLIEEMKSQAQKEAQLLIDQAKIDAERIIADAHQEAMQLEGQIRDLRRYYRETFFRIKKSLEYYLKLMDEESILEEDFEKLLDQVANQTKEINVNEENISKLPDGNRADTSSLDPSNNLQTKDNAPDKEEIFSDIDLIDQGKEEEDDEGIDIIDRKDIIV